MNLFNYLMAKKGHNTSVRDDLFAYLLGKRTPQEVKTATGTTISITDAKGEKIVSLTLSKESTQDGTPTPSNPVEVKTVKGYRNLFDKDNANVIDGYIASGDNYINYYATNHLIYINCESNKTYTIQKNVYSGGGLTIGYTTNIPQIGQQVISRDVFSNTNHATFTTPANANYIVAFVYNDVDNSSGKTLEEVLSGIQITEGTEELPYVPYGNNYVAITNTNGTDTNYYTIPLNDNEIVGKGINLDELIINKHGQCFINKKFAKIDSYNGETITTDYWSTTGGLDIGATIYYVLETPQLIDINYTVDIELFEGVNNISNSEDMNMILKYY